MEMEIGKPTRQVSTQKGKWTIRKNRELLKAIRDNRDGWEEISRRLEISVKDCKQHYAYLIHSDKYALSNLSDSTNSVEEDEPIDSFTVTSSSEPSTAQRDDSKEKKKRRAIKKSTNQKAQISLKNRYYPEAYAGWEESRRRLWDAIPFNANEYYMRYLPPSVEAHGEWTTEEKKALLEAVKIYPPNDKWGLFSLHFPGRTGCECQEMFIAMSSVTNEPTPVDSVNVEMSSKDLTCAAAETPLVESISTPSPPPLSSSPPPLLLLEDGASESSVGASEPTVSSDELKILSDLLPDAAEDSVHGSEDSVHSWEVVRNEEASRLVVRHNIVFSDSELSVGDASVASKPSSPENGSSEVSSPVAVKDVPSVELSAALGVSGVLDVVSSVDSFVNTSVTSSMASTMTSMTTTIPPVTSSVTSSMTSSIPSSMTSSIPSPITISIQPPPPPAQSHQPTNTPTSSPPRPQRPISPSKTPLPTPLIFTPPRSHKRTNPAIQQVTNDSPTCSPSKRLSTAISVSRTLETPKRPQRVTKTSVESPTKVVEDTSTLPVDEPKRPLSTRVRRLLTLQAEERNRFQRLMRHQTSGLYEAFQRERKDGKKPFAEIQKTYMNRYDALCRALQLQYNSMISTQIEKLRYYCEERQYASLVDPSLLHSLHIPKLSFSLDLFS